MAQPILYTLEQGEEYYIEFWVSPRDNSWKICHNIGITLTENPFSLLCIPDCNIYVENDSSNPLDDKEAWTKVSGTFEAVGGEAWIHIGNFLSDSLSQWEWVDDGNTNPANWYSYAYYYIDDVWLSHVDSAGYVGIDPLATAEGVKLEAYPNPAKEVIQLSVDGFKNEKIEVAVTDMWGRQLPLEKEGPGNKVGDSFLKLNVSDWPNGLYLITATTEKGERFTQRVVVE